MKIIMYVKINNKKQIYKYKNNKLNQFKKIKIINKIMKIQKIFQVINKKMWKISLRNKKKIPKLKKFKMRMKIIIQNKINL